MDFLTDWGVIIALVCSGAAVAYGVVTSRWLLSLFSDPFFHVTLATSFAEAKSGANGWPVSREIRPSPRRSSVKRIAMRSPPGSSAVEA